MPIAEYLQYNDYSITTIYNRNQQKTPKSMAFSLSIKDSGIRMTVPWKNLHVHFASVACYHPAGSKASHSWGPPSGTGAGGYG